MAGMTVSSNNIAAPRWCAEHLGRETLAKFPAKVDAHQFKDANGVKVTLTATKAADQTSISCVALSGPIPKNALLYFGESKEFARVTTAAAAGATSIAVEALPSQIESGDVAVYSQYNRMSISSGTFLGRTLAERDAGTGFGPWAEGDDEEYLLAFDIQDAFTNPDCELVLHGVAIRENYLPDWSTLNDDIAGVDAVQTVALGGTLSGGQFKVGGTLSTGVFKWSEDIAYNANLAALQAGYDTVFGAGKVTIAGTVASHTVTFDGAGYTELPQELIQVDANEVTGITSVSVTPTTEGVAAVTGVSVALARLREIYSCIKGEA